MQTYKIADAARKFSKLIAAVEAGETVEIMKRDKVVARLMPPEPKAVIKFGTLTGYFPKGAIEAIDEPMSERDLKLWEGRGEDSW